MESPHTVEAFLMRAVLIGLRFRVRTGRSNRSDRIDNIIRPKSPGQDNRRAHKLDDAAADGPIVRYAKRPNLAVGSSMAVQEQEVSDPVVAASNSDARLVHDGNASHQEHAGQLALEGRGNVGAEQFGGSPQMDDSRLELPRPFFDQRNVVGQEQR
jgi:hypothetical protein